MIKKKKDRLVEVLRNLVERKMGSSVLSDVMDGLPFRLDLIEELRKIMGDVDLGVVDRLRKGVDIGAGIMLEPSGP